MQLCSQMKTIDWGYRFEGKLKKKISILANWRTQENVKNKTDRKRRWLPKRCPDCALHNVQLVCQNVKLSHLGLCVTLELIPLMRLQRVNSPIGTMPNVKWTSSQMAPCSKKCRPTSVQRQTRGRQVGTTAGGGGGGLRDRLRLPNLL